VDEAAVMLLVGSNYLQSCTELLSSTVPVPLPWSRLITVEGGWTEIAGVDKEGVKFCELECGPMPNVMVALPI